MHLPVVIRQEPDGQFTAQVAGIPEFRATASDRGDAVRQLRKLVAEADAREELTEIVLVPTITPSKPPTLRDPRDPMEIGFVEEIARHRREMDAHERIWHVEEDDIEGQRLVEESRQARKEELKGTIWDYDLP